MNISSLVKTLRNYIVLLPDKKRGFFNKTIYNPNAIVHPLVQNPYRKSNLHRWTDKSKIWPPILPEAYKG